MVDAEAVRYFLMHACARRIFNQLIANKNNGRHPHAKTKMHPCCIQIRTIQELEGVVTMEKEELEELERKEDERIRKIMEKMVKELRQEKLKEPIAKRLYPEIPWRRDEIRGFIVPHQVKPWLALPFYEKPILNIFPLDEARFRQVYGVTSQELLELWKKRRVYLTKSLYSMYYGKEYEHLDCILENEPPVFRGSFAIVLSVRLEKLHEFEEEAKGLHPIISHKPNVYASLCAAGFKKRVMRGVKKILTLKDKEAIESYGRWTSDLAFAFTEAPHIGSPSVMDSLTQFYVFWPLGTTSRPSEAFIPEITESLLELTDFRAPAHPNDVNIDLLIETQDAAKDLRKAYKEFSSHVKDLRADEALETKDAVGYAADEFARTAPFLDRVSSVMRSSISIGCAALTYTALQWLLGPWLSAITAGGELYATLRQEQIKEWIEGKYARLLGKVGLGPFAWTHTWRAQRVMRSAKKRLAKR